MSLRAAGAGRKLRHFLSFFSLALLLLAGAFIPSGAARRARAAGPEEVRGAQVLIGPRGAAGGFRRRRMNRSRQAIGALHRNWHLPPSHGALQVWSAIDPKPLTLIPAHGADDAAARAVLTPDTAHGGWDAGDLGLAGRVFAATGDGPCAVAPRLLDVVYRATLEFRAPHVNVVGGCRVNDGASRHSAGMGVDLAFPGVDDLEVARFVATLGYVGIGYYPSGGFLHVDVRDASHYWVDRAEPGAAADLEIVLERSAARTDVSATRYRQAAPTEAPPGAAFEPEEAGEIEAVFRAQLLAQDAVDDLDESANPDDLVDSGGDGPESSAAEPASGTAP